MNLLAARQYWTYAAATRQTKCWIYALVTATMQTECWVYACCLGVKGLYKHIIRCIYACRLDECTGVLSTKQCASNV